VKYRENVALKKVRFLVLTLVLMKIPVCGNLCSNGLFISFSWKFKFPPESRKLFTGICSVLSQKN